MGFRIAAELTVLIHFAFIAFALFGGLLCLKSPRFVWLHVPALIWAVLVSINNWMCPLTPLENFFLARAGAATYEGDFIARYLLPIIYPADLTPALRIVFGAIVLAINIAIYAIVIYRARASKVRELRRMLR